VVGLDDSVNVLRRHWHLISWCALTGLALGLLSLTLRSNSFVSDSLVEVRPLISQSDSPNLDAARQVNTETEQSIASSQRVVERALALVEASEELGTDDLDDPAVEERAMSIAIEGDRARTIQSQIEVTFERNSLVLQIEASAGSPERAQELAQAVAHAYLDFRINAATGATNEARQRLLDREEQLLAELDDIASQIELLEQELLDTAEVIDPAEPTNFREQVRPAQLRSLETSEVSKRQNLAGIGNRLANIDSITINAGEILDDAEVPTSASGIPAPVGPVAGLLLGLGLGVAVAFAQERSDVTVRDPLVELAEIGSEILGFSPPSNHIAVTEGSEARVDEAYRRTQAGLLYKMDSDDRQIVLVTGTTDADSSDTAAVAAANLAVAAARIGRKTLLVLADLRHPVIHRRFRVDNTQGLAEVINGKVSLSDVSQQVPELITLSVLPPGADIAAPTRLLQSSNMGRLLDKARSGYDFIVVQAPTLTDYADAVVLGPLCDTAVLVVEPHRSRRADVESSLRQLKAVGIDVSGSIVAETVDARTSR
jgi:capsular exopolysaccharide synthesis family protein